MLTKGHNDMMHDNFDDKMFKDLLGDYAAPLAEDGFSHSVMASLPQRDKVENKLRSVFISTGAIIGGGIAAAQIPAVWGYISGVKLPTLTVPNMDIAQLETAASSSPSYMLIAAGLMALMIFWLGSALLLENDI